MNVQEDDPDDEKQIPYKDRSDQVPCLVDIERTKRQSDKEGCVEWKSHRGGFDKIVCVDQRDLCREERAEGYVYQAFHTNAD